MTHDQQLTLSQRERILFAVHIFHIESPLRHRTPPRRTASRVWQYRVRISRIGSDSSSILEVPDGPGPLQFDDS